VTVMLGLWPGTPSASPHGRIRFHRGFREFLPISGKYWPLLPESPDEAEDCIAFNNKVLDSFDADRNIQIVVLASYWTDPLVDPYEHDKAWIVTGAEPRGPKPGFEASERLLSASLQSTISALQSAGKRVLVFQDVPLFAEDPFGASELSIYHSESRSQIDFTRVSPPIPERRLR